MSREGGVTLQQLLNSHGRFDPPLLWELLHILTFYLKNALKDPATWQHGPVFLICSSKIVLYSDGTVSIKQGSIGEYDDSLFVAPEYYNTDSKLSTPTATEQIYVYCLGMTMYSIAEYDCEDEVELPEYLEDVLIGMVNEVAVLRTSLTVISQACQANIPMSKKSALKDLIQKYLGINVMEDTTRSLPPAPPPPPLSLPPPPNVTKIPPSVAKKPAVAPSVAKKPAVAAQPSVASTKRDVTRTASAPVVVATGDRVPPRAATNQPKDDPYATLDDADPYATAELLDDADPYATAELLGDADPYSTAEILDHTPNQSRAATDQHTTNLRVAPGKHTPNPSIDDGYSNADDLELAAINDRRTISSKSASNKDVSSTPNFDDGYSNADELELRPADQRTTTRDTTSSPAGRTQANTLSREPSICSSEPENPYGTAKPRCTPDSCSHTPNDISYMYSTVQKLRQAPSQTRPSRSSSGRVEGYRLDTTISATSEESVSPIQPTVRRNGKPIIIQLPSNKRINIPAEREDSIRKVFKLVTSRLAIEDASLFGLMNTPFKGIWEYIPLDHKLKVYATDKWKVDTPNSPPIYMKLAVKFYPPAPHKFVNPVTRLEFFLSIRNLILDGSYQISMEAAFNLAALSLQADIGDYYDKRDYYDKSQYFEPHNYVPPDVMSEVSYQHASKEIPMLHSKLDDMSQNEAIMRYLQIASHLPDYGVHFFEVTERNYYDTEHTCIGISLRNVILYGKSAIAKSRRGAPQRIPWNKIMNLSYKNKTFILDISTVRKNKNQYQRYNFETESTKVSRLIMTLCADTHKFYLKLKNMLPAEDDTEPMFTVRDYTPSPRSVITNNSCSDQVGSEESSRHAGNKVININRTDSISKRPPPNNQLVAKYVCLTKTDSSQSLGMTIIGGDGTHGIYVDKLATGGLANLDGRIRKGDMLLSVNRTSLKSMTHKEAVDLITSQPCRVELELVETSGDIPYDMLGGSETESNQSLEIDGTRMLRMPPSIPNRASSQSSLPNRTSTPTSNNNKTTLTNSYSAPAGSSPTPWYTARSPGNAQSPSNTRVLPSNTSVSPSNTRVSPSNTTRVSPNNQRSPASSTSTLPVSLQNRIAMQERYNLVREPQPSTNQPYNRGQTIAGYNQVEQSSPRPQSFRASGVPRSPSVPGYHGDVTIPRSASVPGQDNHSISNGGEMKLLNRRLTRGSSEQITQKDGSDQDSFRSDSSPGQLRETSRVESVSSVTKSDEDCTEQNHSNQKIVSSTRDPFSRIFTVYLTKHRGSLGMSIRVDKGVVYVRDVFANGPAAVSGMIEKGDAVLSVNGTNLTDMSNQEVITILQQAPANVTLVMSWGTANQAAKISDSNRVGMQFRVTLDRGTSGFGFTTRSTYMGNESFIRIKSVTTGGPAFSNGCLEEGDILLSVGGESLENTTERALSDILGAVATPAQFVIYRPDTIRTFNPHKYETGTILPVAVMKSVDLLGFVLCSGYPYYRNSTENTELHPNDRLLRVGKVCCQGIKSAQLQTIIKDSTVVESQIFRPCDISENTGVSVPRIEKKLDLLSLTDELMEKAETIILQKKEQGLGFSLLGQQDGKRIVHGVSVKTVLTVGAAYDEGRLSPGDLIIMVNGRSMIGITQSKALSTIRKSSGEVVLTIVPGYKRNPDELTQTERKLIGHFERTTDM